MHFGPRAACSRPRLLLLFPSYGILFHGLASDALFAAAFAGWALLLARAIVRPSLITFAVAGLGMGGLVLVRPANQVLIVMTFLPLLLRAPWSERARWAAASSSPSTAVTQGWKAVMTLRYGDATGLKPSGPSSSSRCCSSSCSCRPLGRGGSSSPRSRCSRRPRAEGRRRPRSRRPRRSRRVPPAGVFLFRAFEIDPIISPDNGPESRKLADVVERRLLPYEPVPLLRRHARRRVLVRERSDLRRRDGSFRRYRPVGRDHGGDSRASAASSPPASRERPGRCSEHACSRSVRSSTTRVADSSSGASSRAEQARTSW